jgi:hypothetical protein
MGAIWRRGICGGFCMGFFDSGENGRATSPNDVARRRRGHLIKIVSWSSKQIFNTVEERGLRGAMEEGRIALRAKRLPLIQPNRNKLDWHILPSKLGSRPIGRTAARPGDFLRGPSRPSFFLRVKKSSLETAQFGPLALP